MLRLWRNRPYATDVSTQVQGRTTLTTHPQQFMGQSCCHQKAYSKKQEGNGETNSLDVEGAQTQSQSRNEMASFGWKDLTTAEETEEAPAVQREGEARRYGGRQYPGLGCCGHHPRRGPGWGHGPIDRKLKWVGGIRKTREYTGERN